MRHKYSTEALILSRTPRAEAGLMLTVLTSEFGLIRAVASGARRPGAKLAHALQTLRRSDLMLVRGKDGWRITGALLSTDHFTTLTSSDRHCVARVAGLLLRLMPGEESDPRVYECFTQFISGFPFLSVEEVEAAESLAVLRLLALLGTDAGDMPPAGYDTSALAYAKEHRSELIGRINRGITASAL